MNKNQFVKMLFTVYSDYLKDYQFDGVFDLRHILKIIQEQSDVKTNQPNESQFVYQYFRKMGTDIRMSTESDSLHETYYKNNTMCICSEFLPCEDKILVIVVKDDNGYLTKLINKIVTPVTMPETEC